MIKLSAGALKRAQLVPSAVFASPAAVVKSAGLSPAQKIRILRRWEFDLRRPRRLSARDGAELNAGGGPDCEAMLAELREALAALGADASEGVTDAGPLASPAAPVLTRAASGRRPRMPVH